MAGVVIINPATFDGQAVAGVTSFCSPNDSAVGTKDIW